MYDTKEYFLIFLHVLCLLYKYKSHSQINPQEFQKKASTLFHMMMRHMSHDKEELSLLTALPPGVNGES